MKIRVGEKIRRLRELQGLTQEELANRTDLTKGYISQLERDLTSPSIQTLCDILESLGTDFKDFFADERDDKIVFGKEDVTTTLLDEGVVIDWLIPSAQKYEMEPIKVTLSPGSAMKKDAPHPGQEFGYILSGSVRVYYGNRSYRVKKGESFYYTCDKTHFVKNESSKKATFLWVSTPPNF